MKNTSLLATAIPRTADAAGYHQPETGSRDFAVACPFRHSSRPWLAAAVVAGLLGITWQPLACHAEAAGDEAQGTQVLTRGPVHEAFAGVVAFNPEPGVVVPKAPPEAIEELPPAERPEGNNVTWIPGYWAWDDERSDFLWVSGIWRALPPGRQWIAGYWAQTADGNQWTSGYWADATAQETTYLPAPPPTVEDGPNIAAPSADYGWTPGSWVWRQQRYAWRPGYWAAGRADWGWMPAHYVWTPRGYVFVDGYWDYSVARRGVLFAPVAFSAGVYAQPGYAYSPSVAINLALFAEQLFLRPTYHHYYFGDYYAPSYHQGGFVAAYSYQSSRFGYDPIYAHQRWEHRQDRGWEKSVEETYQFRRDHENARPPRTWAALKTLEANPAEAKLNHAVMATPIDQLAKRKDGALHFQTVPQADREKLALRSQEVQKSRELRRTTEIKGLAATAGKPIEPSTVKLNKSTIVGKNAAQFKKGEMPPEVPRTPKTDLKVLPKADPKAVAKTDPKLEPKTDPKVVTKTDPKVVTKTDPKVLPKTDAKFEPKSDVKVVPKTDLKPRERVVTPGNKTDLTPKEKFVPKVPEKAEVTPHKSDVVPRKVDVAPREKFVPPVVKPDVTPRRALPDSNPPRVKDTPLPGKKDPSKDPNKDHSKDPR